MGNKNASKIKEGTPHLTGQMTKIPQGVLTVRVLDAVFDHDTSPIMKMDPLLKLKLTTQKFHSKTQIKAGQTPHFDQQFNFLINSDSIGQGRVLQLGVWDKGQTFDTQVGYGILDVDPIILNKLTNIHQKCYIAYNREPAGHVNLILSFREQLVGVLFVHVLSASIRRKLGVGDMNCVARVAIGEAVETTRPSKDTKDQMPSWDQTFRIPIVKSVEEGTLQIIDHRMGTDKVVGETALFVNQLAGLPQESYHQTEIWHKEVEAGTVKFIALYIDLQKVQQEKRQEFLQEIQRDLRLREYEILTAQSQFRRSTIHRNPKPQIPIQATFQPITPAQKHQQLPRMNHSQPPLKKQEEINLEDIINQDKPQSPK